MKIKKATYLSLILLSCFLISTTLGVAITYTSATHSKALSFKTNSVSSSDNESNISNGFNFVKTENENESENDYESACTIHEFIIPFIFSFSGIEASHPVISKYSEAPVKISNTIYIAICNFRI